MYFGAPLWLLALIPWVGLVIWMLRGRGEIAPVPFVDLWRGPIRTMSRRHWRWLPEAAVAAMLLAIAMAILAASRPRVRMGPRTQAMTIIVDRGASMMPRTRLDEALRQANRRLLNNFAAGSPVKLIAAPGGQVIPTTLADWLSAAMDLPAVAAPSEGEIQQTVMRESRLRHRLIVVVTDRNLGAAGRGIVQFYPPAVKEDVGIMAVAARLGAPPQVMVKLRNLSDRTRARLTIASGANKMEKTVVLPPRGSERAYFFDAAKFSDLIEVSLMQKDDFPLDDRAWLARQRMYPRIELRPGLPSEVSRIVAAYVKVHPADDGNHSIIVSSGNLPNNASGVVVDVRRQPVPGSVPLLIENSPVTANLTISHLENLQLAQMPKSQGWRPVITAGGKPLLAVRTDGKRQVWIGFSSPDFPAATDFVMLWTNVLDYLSGQSQQYASHPPALLTPDWKPLDSEIPAKTAGLWPGVYRRSDGALRAVNVPAVSMAQSVPANPDELAISRLRRLGSVDLSWLAGIGSLVCALVGTVLWPRLRRTPLPVQT